MEELPDGSVDLVVTSPPYPMIGMWDDVFSSMNPEIGENLKENRADLAYDLMHRELGKVWSEVYRVMKPGGIACINIGDATRTIGSEFRLFPSHSTISIAMRKLGFHESPSIIWKKQTNSPNKFLGSGTMPPGAYVTLEHEHILIFRKPPRRQFTGDQERKSRLESSYFWEERNAWFTDVWESIKGIRQGMSEVGARKRSAAFPFEVPYRLINMFSVVGDTVLDPFLGTGTTTFAAIAAMRNSIGYEREKELSGKTVESTSSISEFLNEQIEKRVHLHSEYVKKMEGEGSLFSYFNENHGFRVKTRNERDTILKKVHEIILAATGNELLATYCGMQKE